MIITYPIVFLSVLNQVLTCLISRADSWINLLCLWKHKIQQMPGICISIFHLKPKHVFTIVLHIVRVYIYITCNSALIPSRSIVSSDQLAPLIGGWYLKIISQKVTVQCWGRKGYTRSIVEKISRCRFPTSCWFDGFTFTSTIYITWFTVVFFSTWTMIGHSWLDIDNFFHSKKLDFLQVNSISCVAGIFQIQIHGYLKSDWLHACSNQWNVTPYIVFTLQLQPVLQLGTNNYIIAIYSYLHISLYSYSDIEEPSAKKRGPYRRYLTDLTCPVPRTIRWRNQHKMTQDLSRQINTLKILRFFLTFLT